MRRGAAAATSSASVTPRPRPRLAADRARAWSTRSAAHQLRGDSEEWSRFLKPRVLRAEPQIPSWSRSSGGAACGPGVRVSDGPPPRRRSSAYTSGMSSSRGAQVAGAPGREQPCDRLRPRRRHHRPHAAAARRALLGVFLYDSAAPRLGPPARRRRPRTGGTTGTPPACRFLCSSATSPSASCVTPELRPAVRAAVSASVEDPCRWRGPAGSLAWRRRGRPIAPQPSPGPERIANCSWRAHPRGSAPRSSLAWPGSPAWPPGRGPDHPGGSSPS
jgi:hypothetical protein